MCSSAACLSLSHPSSHILKMCFFPLQSLLGGRGHHPFHALDELVSPVDALPRFTYALNLSILPCTFTISTVLQASRRHWCFCARLASEGLRC